MTLVNIGVQDAKVTLVPDQSYFPVVRKLIARGQHVCFCNLFIIDVRSRADADLTVHSLLLELASASWRGVDVRVLVGGSRQNLDMAITAELCRETAQNLNVDCHWLTARPTRGSHAKWVVVDDLVLIGSHNWSSGAFKGQTQDSVLVHSAALAAYLSSRFVALWDRAETGA